MLIVICITFLISIKNKLKIVCYLSLGALIYLFIHFHLNVALQQWYFVTIYFCFSIGLIIINNEIFSKLNFKFLKNIVNVIMIIIPIIYTSKRIYINTYNLSEHSAPGYYLAKEITKLDQMQNIF